MGHMRSSILWLHRPTTCSKSRCGIGLFLWLLDFILLMLVLFLNSEFCGIYMVIALSISRIPLCSNLQFIKIFSVFSCDTYWRWRCIGKFFWLDRWFVWFLCWVLSIFSFSPGVYMLLNVYDIFTMLNGEIFVSFSGLV